MRRSRVVLRTLIGVSSLGISVLFALMFIVQASDYLLLRQGAGQTGEPSASSSRIFVTAPGEAGHVADAATAAGLQGQQFVADAAVWNRDQGPVGVWLSRSAQGGSYLPTRCADVAGEIGEGAEGTVTVDSNSADRLGLSIGATLTLQTRAGPQEVRVSGICAEPNLRVERFHPYLFAASKGQSIHAYAYAPAADVDRTANRVFVQGDGAALAYLAAILPNDSTDDAAAFSRQFLHTDVGLYVLVVPLCAAVWAASLVGGMTLWCTRHRRRAGSPKAVALTTGVLVVLMSLISVGGAPLVGPSSTAQTCSNIGMTCPPFTTALWPAVLVVVGNVVAGLLGARVQLNRMWEEVVR